MSELRYRTAGTDPEALALGECTIRGAKRTDGVRYWNLWACVQRTDNGKQEWLVVPVIPGGAYTETGPGGRSWGLTRSGPNRWQVSPSIDAGWWHQTPALVDVPDGEPWTTGAAP